MMMTVLSKKEIRGLAFLSQDKIQHNILLDFLYSFYSSK